MNPSAASVDSSVGREIEDTVAAITQLGATLCPVRIGTRIAYSRAQQTGRTAQEIEPDGKAAQEIKQLYAYACMNLSTYAGMNLNTHEGEGDGQRVAGGAR